LAVRSAALAVRSAALAVRSAALAVRSAALAVRSAALAVRFAALAVRSAALAAEAAFGAFAGARAAPRLSCKHAPALFHSSIPLPFPEAVHRTCISIKYGRDALGILDLFEAGPSSPAQNRAL
jgi:hypothetical protein